MNFEQFQQNVQTWAAARGIYEHSTPLAQALKAVSEVGELADAVIKKDMDALRDAIGDVAVCLVNWAHMFGCKVTTGPLMENTGTAVPAQVLAADVAYLVGYVVRRTTYRTAAPNTAHRALHTLQILARNSGLTFEECCQQAWDEIKDRTGHMVAGGAFVKD